MKVFRQWKHFANALGHKLKVPAQWAWVRDNFDGDRCATTAADARNDSGWSPAMSHSAVCVCVWTIWTDVKLLPWLTELLFLIRFFAMSILPGAYPISFSFAGGQGLQWLPCPTKLCHWRGSNWGRPVVYLQIAFNCWTRCPLRCYSFSGRILLHCFSRLVIHHFLSGLLECFFCTYDAFHISNSIRCFWASVSLMPLSDKVVWALRGKPF